MKNLIEKSAIKSFEKFTSGECENFKLIMMESGVEGERGKRELLTPVTQ